MSNAQLTYTVTGPNGTVLVSNMASAQVKAPEVVGQPTVVTQGYRDLTPEQTRAINTHGFVEVGA